MALQQKAGADVNFVDFSGITNLILAVQYGLPGTVQCLLDAGANPNIPDEFGRTPIEFAASEGRRDMVEMLFPLTSPIPTLPEWSIDGIISHVESFGLKPRACVSFYPHLQLHIVFISMDYYHNCYYPAVLPVIQRRNSFNLVLS